jgi:protein-disulfide isomerase
MMLIFCAGMIYAQEPTKDTAIQAMETLKSLNPQWGAVNFEFDKMEPSPVPNFYQARFYVKQQDRLIPVVVYISKDSKILFLGQVINLTEKKNLTQDFAGSEKYPPIDMSKIDLNNGAKIGNPNAPIKIVEYSDFQCPFCKRGAGTIKEVLNTYGDKVFFVFKHLPLPMHNLAKNMAIAAECAAEQNPKAFWAFHDAFFSDDFVAGDADMLKEKVSELAKKENLDVAKFQDCYSNVRTEAKVMAQSNEAKEINVQSTPTFIINGEKIAGALPLEHFKKVIDQKLEEAKATDKTAKKEEPQKGTKK